MISKNLLNMNCFVQEVIGKSADRKPVYGELFELKNIWVDLNNGLSNDSLGRSPSDSGVLYFDSENSEPKEFEPTENDVFYLETDGRKYTVSSIKKCHSLKGFDHWEIGLK